MEEVPFDVVAACCVEDVAVPDSMNVQSEKLLEVLGICLSFERPTKEMARVMLTSKLVYRSLHKRPEWLALAGYRLVQPPPELSCFKLLAALKSQQAQVAGASTWAVPVMTDRVNEEAGRAKRKLKPLLALKSAEDAEVYWTGRLVDGLFLPTFPTKPQCDDMREVLRRIEGLAEASNKPVGPDLVTKLAEAATAGALPARKLNKTVAALLLHDVVSRYRAQKAPTPALPAVAMAKLLAAGGVETIRCFALLMGGVDVDDLKRTLKTKPPPLHSSFPVAARRAIAVALSQLSWLQLVVVRRNEGFFKTLFKSIHIGELTRHLRAGVDPSASKLFLLQALLRTTHYPASAEAFAGYGARGGSGGWAALVAAPLTAVCADPLFSVPEEWLSVEWQESLAGKKLPWPEQFSPVAVLCKYGNGKASWDALFNKGQLTAAQILFQLRGLALLAFPPERIRAYLSGRRSESLGISDVLKLHELLRTTFKPQYVEEVVKKAGAHVGAANGGGQAHHLLPPGADTAEDAYIDEVRIEMSEMSVKDKKGQVRSVKVDKVVSLRFNEYVVEGYLQLLDAALDERMDALAAGVPANPDLTAVISYSEELASNGGRTGLPPSVPSYSRVSLWRGEAVCLEQLEASQRRKLLAGIHWCQASGSAAERIDLDLSVMLFDDKFAPIDYCSFNQLQIPGAKHSGDFTSAPYPDGARETVVLDLPLLREAYPNARYVALAVFSFTGVCFDDLHDASVFVADPEVAGDGPGGTAILGAARLTGSGTSNAAGYIDLGVVAAAAAAAPGEPAAAAAAAAEGAVQPVGSRTTFVFLDHSLASNDRTINFGGRLIGKVLQDNVEMRANPTTLRLATSAAVAAATLCPHVVVACAGPAVALTRADGERRAAFFNRIVAAMAAVAPGLPSPSDSAPPAAFYLRSDVVYFGGTLEPWLAVTRQHKAHKGRRLYLANVHAASASVKKRPKENEQEVMVVNGWDVTAALAGLLQQQR